MAQILHERGLPEPAPERATRQFLHDIALDRLFTSTKHSYPTISRSSDESIRHPLPGQKFAARPKEACSTRPKAAQSVPVAPRQLGTTLAQRGVPLGSKP